MALERVDHDGPEFSDIESEIDTLMVTEQSGGTNGRLGAVSSTHLAMGIYVGAASYVGATSISCVMS
jgi:hypothetical protein